MRPGKRLASRGPTCATRRWSERQRAAASTDKGTGPRPQHRMAGSGTELGLGAESDGYEHAQGLQGWQWTADASSQSRWIGLVALGAALVVQASPVRVLVVCSRWIVIFTTLEAARVAGRTSGQTSIEAQTIRLILAIAQFNTARLTSAGHAGIVTCLRVT